MSSFPLHQIPKLPLRRRPTPSPPPAATSPPPPTFDLRTYWTSLLPSINSALSAAIPINYPPLIFNAMRHSVLTGPAKRAPPILCIAAADLFSTPLSSSLPTACALEMIHAASLVHDDLPCFDAAPLRRGHPSTHSVFGVDTAVLAGDALFPLCFSHIISHTPATVSPARILRIVSEISNSVGATGMAAGQYLDIDGATITDNVVKVLELKFGKLAECSAVCGGIIGSATEDEIERLRRYGSAVGVLYQVVEDILMEGSEGGKMRSNASVVRAVGMERALEIAEELRVTAKREVEEGFGDKCGERVLPLMGFVDYAVERGFMVDGQ